MYGKALFNSKKYKQCLEITNEIMEIGKPIILKAISIVKKNDTKQEIHTIKIEVLLRLGRVDEAEKDTLKIYDELLEKYGGKTNAWSIDYLFKFGKKLHEEGYYNMSLKYLEKVCLMIELFLSYMCRHWNFRKNTIQKTLKNIGKYPRQLKR